MRQVIFTDFESVVTICISGCPNSYVGRLVNYVDYGWVLESCPSCPFLRKEDLVVINEKIDSLNVAKKLLPSKLAFCFARGVNWKALYTVVQNTIQIGVIHRVNGKWKYYHTNDSWSLGVEELTEIAKKISELDAGELAESYKH